ncbi:hypothetical protein EJB05_21270, partial [Eragrostis curvula]
MGLGGCILQAEYGTRMKAALVFFLSTTTPFGVALGLALTKVYCSDTSPTALVVVGLLNAASAGLLHYMALVDLLAADFMGPRMLASVGLQLVSSFLDRRRRHLSWIIDRSMANQLMNLTPVHAASIPESFLLPADRLRPATTDVSLPVIDMSRGRDEVRRAILDSGKEYGFIQATGIAYMQVVNHGISEQVLHDMYAVCHEFFDMPAADKAEFYSEDKSMRNRLFCGSGFETLGEKYWVDVLELLYPLPSGDTKDWPHKPQRLREVVGNYTALARGVAMEILRLLCEGLGLRPDYFVGDISGARVVIDINYYPPSPNPSRTLGLPPHCDRDLMTVLLPGAVPGLEIAFQGGWIKVVTNGILKSVEHRAATNFAEPRLSVASFIVPADHCVVGPAEEFVSEDNPPRYRTLTVGEFKRMHNVVNLGSSINQVINIKNNQKGE